MPIQVSGSGSAAAVDAAWVKSPSNIDQKILALFIQAAGSKQEDVQVQKAKVEGAMVKMQRANELLTKLGRLDADVDDKTTVEAAKIVQDRLYEINGLIKELGLTNLFPGSEGLTGPLPSQRETNLKALNDVLDNYQALGVWPMVQSTLKVAGITKSEPTALTAQERQVLTNRWLPEMSASDIQKINSTPNQSQIYKDAAAGTGLLAFPAFSATGADATRLQNVWKEKVAAINGPYKVEGGVNMKHIGRDVTDAYKRMEAEVSNMGQKQQMSLTDAQQAISTMNNFLEAIKSLLDKLSSMSRDSTGKMG